MRTQIKRRRKLAEIRSPQQVMEAASLSIGQIVDVRAECGRIVITTIDRPRYELTDLLNKMTPDTFHDQVDFGRPVGGERSS